ncbi:MAG: hypothetical protein SFU99_05205 [Saprospiraceae bacterium]|nr:hypothetical protein [Saprospiraceae bacterium]
MENSNNNLNTFRILFLVQGILVLLCSLLFVFYAFMGVFFTDIIELNEETAEPMPFNPGSIFIVIGSIGFFITVALGIVTLFASKYLKEIRNYNFIFVVAILNCFTGVLGILLGVFTLVELNKPHIKALFNSLETERFQV